MKASLSDDGKTVTLTGRIWAGSFPVDHLDAQIRMYSELAQRAGRAHEDVYAPTVAELRTLRRQISEAAKACS